MAGQRFNPTEDQAKTILAGLKDRDKSLAEIGAEVGATESAISRIATALRKQGIQIPKRKSNRKSTGPLGELDWGGMAQKEGIEVGDAE